MKADGKKKKDVIDLQITITCDRCDTVLEYNSKDNRKKKMPRCGHVTNNKFIHCPVCKKIIYV